MRGRAGVPVTMNEQTTVSAAADARSFTSGPLTIAAERLADRLGGLVPSVAIGIAVDIAPGWQLLAATGRGAAGVPWLQLLEGALDMRFGPSERTTHAVLPIETTGRRALALVVAGPGEVVSESALHLLAGPVRDGGGQLALAASEQRGERARHRAAALDDVCRRAASTPAELCTAVATLWPGAEAEWQPLANDAEADSSHRLDREAIDLHQTIVEPAPGAVGPDFRYRIALPVDERAAVIVHAPAWGEPVDLEGISIARVIVRDAALHAEQGRVLAENRVLRQLDDATGCGSSEAAAPRLGSMLADAREHAQGVAVLLLQIDQPDVETAAPSMATAISEAAEESRGEVFRIRPWRYAVFVANASGRQAAALAQRLRQVSRSREDSATTASVGIALWPLHGETPQELLDAAEQALLAAAAEGDAQSMAAHHGRRYAQPTDVLRSIEALRALARLADHVCFKGLAHSEAVAHRAARIARILALPHEELLAVQLAGELHEIGRLALPRTSAEAARNPDNARLTAAHAALGARIIQAAGLPVVAEIVASQYDRYDAPTADATCRVTRFPSARGSCRSRTPSRPYPTASAAAMPGAGPPSRSFETSRAPYSTPTWCAPSSATSRVRSAPRLRSSGGRCVQHPSDAGRSTAIAMPRPIPPSLGRGLANPNTSATPDDAASSAAPPIGEEPQRPAQCFWRPALAAEQRQHVLRAPGWPARASRCRTARGSAAA